MRGVELQHLGFVLEMWDDRWYNQSTYCQLVTNLQSSQFFGVVDSPPIVRQVGEPGNRETVYVEKHEAADHLNSLTYGNYAGPPDVGDPDDLDGDYGGDDYYYSDEDEEHTRLTYSEVSHEAIVQ
jgi:hypothetical protein